MRSGPWPAAATTRAKQRPVVILQDDRFDATASVTVCAFTTDPAEAPLFRIEIQFSPTQTMASEVQAA